MVHARKSYPSGVTDEVKLKLPRFRGVFVGLVVTVLP